MSGRHRTTEPEIRVPSPAAAAEEVTLPTRDSDRDSAAEAQEPNQSDPYQNGQSAAADLEAVEEDPFEPPTMGWQRPAYWILSRLGERFDRPDWGRGLVSKTELALREDLIRQAERHAAWQAHLQAQADLRKRVRVGANRFTGTTVAIVHKKGGVGKTPTAGNLANGLAEYLPGRRIAMVDFNPAQAAAGHTSGVFDRTREVPRWVLNDPHDLTGYGIPTANVLEIYEAIVQGAKVFPEWVHNRDHLERQLNGVKPEVIDKLQSTFAALRGRQLLDPELLLSMMQPSHWGLRTAVPHKPRNAKAEFSATMVGVVLDELVKHYELVIADTGNDILAKNHIAITGRADVLIFPALVTVKDACEDLIETLDGLRWKLETEGYDPTKVDHGIIAISGIKPDGPTLDYYVEEFFPEYPGDIVEVPWSDVIDSSRMSRPDLLRADEPEVWHAYLQMADHIINRLPEREETAAPLPARSDEREDPEVEALAST